METGSESIPKFRCAVAECAKLLLAVGDASAFCQELLLSRIDPGVHERNYGSHNNPHSEETKRDSILGTISELVGACWRKNGRTAKDISRRILRAIDVGCNRTRKIANANL